MVMDEVDFLDDENPENESKDLFYEIIATINVLHLAYQHAHANVAGASFYSDHVLLQRLYETNSSVEERDGLMERFVGLYDSPVLLQTVLEEMNAKAGRYNQAETTAESSVKSNTAYFSAILGIELELQRLLNSLIQCIESQEMGGLEQGVVDLLQGIANSHQEAIYLIKRRITE